MQCPRCKGDVAARLIRYVQEYKGDVIIIENVPAEVCTQCGEPLIRPDVAEKIQKLVWEQPGSKRKKVAVASYDFAEVA